MIFVFQSNPSYEYINEMIKSDEMHVYEQKIRHLAEKNILISANLISTIIDDYFNDGYSWCVETIKNSYFSPLAVDLELKKAVIYLKQDDIQQAIETLKYFEKKESNIAINAAINLSFIYILVRNALGPKTAQPSHGLSIPEKGHHHRGDVRRNREENRQLLPGGFHQQRSLQHAQK